MKKCETELKNYLSEETYKILENKLTQEEINLISKELITNIKNQNDIVANIVIDTVNSLFDSKESGLMSDRY